MLTEQQKNNLILACISFNRACLSVDSPWNKDKFSINQKLDQLPKEEHENFLTDEYIWYPWVAKSFLNYTIDLHPISIVGEECWDENQEEIRKVMHTYHCLLYEAYEKGSTYSNELLKSEVYKFMPSK